MDKLKDFDEFLDSEATEKFYDCCYNIMKSSYLAGYNFAIRENEKQKQNNVIKLPE